MEKEIPNLLKGMERNFIKKRRKLKAMEKQNQQDQKDQKEPSSSTAEKADLLDLAKDIKKDENGIVKLHDVIESHPDIKRTFAQKIRGKQEMIIDSITNQDVIAAGLRYKAASSKALHDQATEIERGRPFGGVNVVIIKR